MDTCLEHSGHASRLNNLEKGQGDCMKNWVIAGMTSLVMQLILVIAGLAMYWIKSKPGV